MVQLTKTVFAVEERRIILSVQCACSILDVVNTGGSWMRDVEYTFVDSERRESGISNMCIKQFIKES